jgi:hypothetical protein
METERAAISGMPFDLKVDVLNRYAINNNGSWSVTGSPDEDGEIVWVAEIEQLDGRGLTGATKWKTTRTFGSTADDVVAKLLGDLADEDATEIASAVADVQADEAEVLTAAVKAEMVWGRIAALPEVAAWAATLVDGDVLSEGRSCINHYDHISPTMEVAILHTGEIENWHVGMVALSYHPQAKRLREIMFSIEAEQPE